MLFHPAYLRLYLLTKVTLLLHQVMEALLTTADFVELAGDTADERVFLKPYDKFLCDDDADACREPSERYPVVISHCSSVSPCRDWVDRV